MQVHHALSIKRCRIKIVGVLLHQIIHRLAVSDGERDDMLSDVLIPYDALFGQGTIRVDGRKLHPAYLFEVKKPEESKGPWDYYKLIGTTPGDQAFRPLSESACPLVKK